MKLKSYLLAFLFSATSLSTFAASVTTVKGQKVLVNLEDGEALPGDEFFLMDEGAKKKAIIRISQVKNGKAIAEVLKGKAEVGYTLQAKASSQKISAEVEAPDTESDSPGRKNEAYLKSTKDSYGLVGGYLMNTMEASQKLSGGAVNKSSMKGNGVSFGGFYDYAFTSQVIGRASVSLDQFQASGSGNNVSGCNGGQCKADFLYLSFYGMGKYNFLEGKYRSWVGLGGGFLFAASKSSTILNTSSVSTNQTGVAALGVDIQTSRKNYVPISLEYAIFPPSSTVSAGMIMLKAGWAWNL